MNDKAVLEELVLQAQRLSLLEKVRLIERIISDLERDLTVSAPPASRSLYGIWADLGSAPSAEEIAAMRREAWANFPREDIA